MILFKLGLLTCLFYIVLTGLLEIGWLAAVHIWGGLIIYFRGNRLFWSAGVGFGAIFGLLWLISFTMAWWIVYQKLKLTLGSIHR